jgi:hypothetical protein
MLIIDAVATKAAGRQELRDMFLALHRQLRMTAQP